MYKSQKIINMKPADNRDALYSIVSSELRILGIKVPKIKKLKSSANKQEKPSAASGCKVFGVSLTEQEWILEGSDYLPKFPVIVAKYLEMFTTNEGLFRKAGSLLRQKQLRIKIENGENWDDAQPNDVAALLKQWLRELPEPIIPAYLQEVFSRCLLLNSENIKVQSVLLSCLLLPAENLTTLVHLLNFLSRLVSCSSRNKMDAHNLAIIMTPNLLQTVSEHTDKTNSIRHQTDLVKLLIINADKVGQVPHVVAQQMQEKDLKLGEIELSAEVSEDSASVPKKRRKSGPVHDFVHEIRKLVGQNLTPVGHSTSKRKADLECISSSVKKRAVAGIYMQGNDGTTECTPVGKTSSSCVASAASKRTIFSPLQISSSHNKSGLLKRKGRKREKSVPKSYRIGMKWQTPQNVNESQNMNSSFSQYIKPGENLTPHPLDQNSVVSLVSPVDSSTPLNTSVIYFPSLGVSPSSPSMFSPVNNYAIPKSADLVQERENLFPNRKKPSFRNSSINNSTNSMEKLEDFHDVRVSPLLAKRENSCTDVPTFSPLKLKTNAAFMVEKEVTRSSHRRRSLRNHVSCGLTDSTSCKIAFQSNSGAKGPRQLPTSVCGCDNEGIIYDSGSVTALKKSSFYMPILNDVSTVDDGKSSNFLTELLSCDLANSSPSRHLNRRTSRSCTSISEMKTKSSNEAQLGKGNSKKGSTSKSSLRRGRPNTIKTGLPSEFCQKYLAESNALSKPGKKKDVCSNSIVDLKNSNSPACTQPHAQESKSHTPKNIRT